MRNLPYTCTEDDLQFLFKKYGEIAEIQFIINKKTRRSKGFAIVTYVFPENAVNAYSALDGTIFKVRLDCWFSVRKFLGNYRFGLEEISLINRCKKNNVFSISVLFVFLNCLDKGDGSV